MIGRTGLALVAVLTCGSPSPATVTFSQPTIYGHGDDSGLLSPARCKITQVETPHVSTYMEQMQKIRAIKGNVYAQCDHAVDELTLSVSIFDADTHQLLIKGRPNKNQGEASLKNLKTSVPCINTKRTNYQVGVLGTSFEKGHEYTEFTFSAVGAADCGHA